MQRHRRLVSGAYSCWNIRVYLKERKQPDNVGTLYVISKSYLGLYIGNKTLLKYLFFEKNHLDQVKGDENLKVQLEAQLSSGVLT